MTLSSVVVTSLLETALLNFGQVLAKITMDNCVLELGLRIEWPIVRRESSILEMRSKTNIQKEPTISPRFGVDSGSIRG